MPEPMSDERLAQIEGLPVPATPNPWTALMIYPDRAEIVPNSDPERIIARLPGWPPGLRRYDRDADAIAIAALPKYVQARDDLLAEVRRLREELDAVSRSAMAAEVRRLHAETDRLRAELDAARKPSAVEELVVWVERVRGDVHLTEDEWGWEAQAEWGLASGRAGDKAYTEFHPTPTAAIEALLVAIREREGRG